MSDSAGKGDRQNGVQGGEPSIFARWLSGFLLAAALILVDPLGISSAADRASERIFLAVSAHLTTPPASGGVATPGQKAITVVLVDDAFMREYRKSPGRGHATWPIPRADQFDLIFAPILDRAPRALFIDWVFHSTTIEDPKAFAMTLEEMGAQISIVGAGTKLLFSDRPDRLASDQRRGCGFRFTSSARLAETAQSHPAISALWPDATWAERVPVRWWGPAHRYPLAPLALGEPPADDTCPTFAPGDPAIASPALALFSLWCEGRKGEALCKGLARRGQVEGYPILGLPAAFAEPSAPRWLAWPSEGRLSIARNANTAGGPAIDPCATEAGRNPLRQLFRSLRLRFGQEEEEVPFNPCFGIDTVSATALRTVMLDEDGNPAGLNDDTLQELFRNRLVLIGTDLDSAPDRAESPVNGASPAVLLHAAVLENLISDGARRLREPPEGPINWGLALSLGIAFVAAFPLSLWLEGPVASTAAAIAGCQGAAARVALVCAALLLVPAALVLHQMGSMARLLLPVTGIALAGVALWGILAQVKPLAGPAGLAARMGGLVLPVGLAGGLFAATQWAPANWISGLAAKLSMLAGFDEGIEQGWRRQEARYHARLWVAILLFGALLVAASLLNLVAPLLPWLLMGGVLLAALLPLRQNELFLLAALMFLLLLFALPDRSIDLLLLLVAFLAALTAMVIICPWVAAVVQACPQDKRE